MSEKTNEKEVLEVLKKYFSYESTIGYAGEGAKEAIVIKVPSGNTEDWNKVNTFFTSK